ncbi:MAG: extracellular solute-binding protein, partial [Deltaproteobacteria bacterium]|nr:extracellular solute-binding protein [Deltaproteobacteria bacterium]
MKLRWLITLCVTFVLLASLSAKAQTEPLTLWHSYRGQEKVALDESLKVFEAQYPGVKLKVLAIPYDVMASKLSTAMPRGHGPDIFIYAHEKVGSWKRAGLVSPLNEQDSAWAKEVFFPETISSLEVDQEIYGYPLSFKSLVLFRNTDLVPNAPRTTDELLVIAESLKEKNIFGLAYQADSFYFHAAWYLGFNARLPLDPQQTEFESSESLDSFTFLEELVQRKVIPQEVTGALVTDLFNRGQASMVISGPWMLGEIDKSIPFALSPLPLVSKTGKAASPFLTTEAAFIASNARRPTEALSLAKFLSGPVGSRLRAKLGNQPVAYTQTWNEEFVESNAVLQAFGQQLKLATPIPNSPAMGQVWEPGDLALKKLLRANTAPDAAALAATRRHQAITRAAPEAADSSSYLIVLAFLILAVAVWAIRRFRTISQNGDLRPLLTGLKWTGPVWVTTGILVFIPFVMALSLAFFSHRSGEWTFVGLGNFQSILSADAFGVFEPLSFYFALVVTVMWTLVNIVLHVGIGIGLALVLNQNGLHLKGFYRVLLIIPWAVPNYITALIWKGMFHRQFGVINAMLEILGMESVAWFSSFWTAFCANVCTNAWLGFPFMMVVCLGALQSIPKELHDAASIDGAGFFAQFKHITWPLLMPAMAPAVMLGIVWTFNQFNIV